MSYGNTAGVRDPEDTQGKVSRKLLDPRDWQSGERSGLKTDSVHCQHRGQIEGHRGG